MHKYALFIKLIVVIFLQALCVKAALSWGVEGHQTVAQIAQSLLTPKAKSEVGKLLLLEPGSSLVSVSTWPDEHANKNMIQWHFIDFPKGSCVYQQERDCPNSNCVIEALHQQIKILGSNQSDADRLLALKYVVHFMGDIHQPLHAGNKENRGGNNYQIQVFGKGSNLHSLWDSGLIKNLNMPTNLLSVNLMSNKVKSGDYSNIDPTNAAIESCNIAREEGFYPGQVVNQSYIKHYTPILEARLKLAGERLAQLLNTTFK